MHRRQRVLWWGLTVVVVLATLGCRLIPVVRGGGFFGIGTGSDAVYYAAAVGWINGRVPYADFFFQQPPGIMIMLAPFVALGEIITDSGGFAAARLGWMLLGALNAVLITRLLRPLGLAAALVGGLCYAIFYPAIQVETTVTLESPGTTAILLALLALRVGNRSRLITTAGQRLALLGAGAALALGAGIKLSGLLALVLVLGWHFAPRRIRGLAWVTLGALVGAAAVWLPFAVRAPEELWRSVVLAHLHRSGSASSVGLDRTARILGLDLWEPSDALVIAAAILTGLAVIAAITVSGARLAAMIMVGYAAYLIAITPQLAEQDPAVVAGPLAVIIGAACHRSIRLLARPLPRRRRMITATVAVLLVAGLLGTGSPMREVSYHSSFPRQKLIAVVQDLPGCITSDDVALLIQLDVLGRNLDRECRLVVDYGGHTTAPPGAPGQAPTARQWQAGLLAYLSEGSGAFHVRDYGGNDAGYGEQVWASWPALAGAGPFTLRRPPG